MGWQDHFCHWATIGLVLWVLWEYAAKPALYKAKKER